MAREPYYYLLNPRRSQNHRCRCIRRLCCAALYLPQKCPRGLKRRALSQFIIPYLCAHQLDSNENCYGERL